MSKFEYKKRDTAADQLLSWAKKHYDDGESITTGSGNPVGNKDASLTVGHHGPTLLQDIDLIDELSHFTHERIPERVVHANGAGAFGYFEVTHDITEYTAASVFSDIGKKTPIAIRFSTVFGERGYADTVLDIRGYAMKFYTEDGIWDLVGNNTPIFFINDAIYFPSLIHILKRNPKTHLRDWDMFWDMISLRPETTHQTLLMFSDRGLPASYRHMHGYGSHTYAFVNKFGKFFYCKFHMKTEQGIKNMSPYLASKIAGQDPDYHLRDLYNAIENKNYPSWLFYVQIMTPEQAEKSPYDPFDMTKVWLHADYPLIPVGRYVLNRMPSNYFSEVEQLAFDPANLIPGVLCVYSSGYNEELRQKGELRKACSKYGFVRQPERRVNTTSRLIKLREVMKSEIILDTAAIDAYIVLSGDEHQSVDVDEYDRRREYISGFSGSYGDAIITQDKAALWTDGRYHLQADEQINCDWLLMREGFKNIPTRSQWLKSQLPFGARVGVDPKIISEFMWLQLKHEIEVHHLTLVALNVSLIDVIWPPNERPPKRNKDAFVWDIEYAGKNYSTKLEETRRLFEQEGADAMIVTALDEISWLLNIKGRDVPFNPFLRSYVIIEHYDVYLYVNKSQLIKNNVTQYLLASHQYTVTDTVIIKDYDEIWADLRTKSQKYNKILVPFHCVFSEGASHAIYTAIPNDKILPLQSPIIFLKALKNPTEIQQMRYAQIVDAAAVCEALAYFEQRYSFGDIFTEMDIASNLDSYRNEQKFSLGSSFRTKVAFGPNAAQPRYEPTPNTNRQIFTNNTVVLDSGGQYYSGTTSVTRTLHFGIPTEDQKEAYTRVLIGSIQLATLTFPSNLEMAAVDVLARTPLWDKGLDYLHDTGHGIGSFSGAQESPIKVHFNSEISNQHVFKPGYFLTSEPGLYREGQFGIRLGNVLEVIEKPWLRHTSGHEFFGFKINTLVPFEPKLLKLSLLSYAHRQWLNHYNELIRINVGAELKKQNKKEGFYWMMEKTKYIPEYGHSNIISSQPILIFITNTFLLLKLFY